MGCNTDEGARLPSVEERVAVAIGDLTDALVSPTNGWRIDYRPTFETGSFLMLLNFNSDGTVRIQSDVIDNDGEFRDQTITYRIDNAQGVELILETYGVFHYLFELERGAFGGEFEFIFREEQEGNLVFSSKTDGSGLIFEPADAGDSNLISTEALSILGQGIFQSEDLAGVGAFGTFNIYVPDNDHTISVTFDLDKRRAKFLGIAVGQDLDEVIANNIGLSLNNETAFSLTNENLILDEIQNISFDGQNYEIGEISIENIVKVADSFCGGQVDSLITFNGLNSGLGNFTASSSLFQTINNFIPGTNSSTNNGLYSINHPFLYDQDDNSIAADIEAVFPDVVVFQWYLGFETSDSTINVLGFVTVDEFNKAEFFLRGYDYVQNGNYLEIAFNGNDLITLDNPTQAQIDGLYQLTDDIFAGGSVYVLEFVTPSGLFEFYNPCSRYKGFLF